MITKQNFIVKIVSGIIFLGTLGLLIGVVQQTPELVPVVWYGYVTAIFCFLYIYSAVWMWNMQKRGLEFYIFLTLCIDILGVVTGFGTTQAYIGPIIFIIILLTQYQKMNKPSFLNR